MHRFRSASLRHPFYETAPTLVGVGAVVGIPGFEPGTPCSQSRCANRTALHPVCVKRRKDNAFSTNSQSDRLPRRKNAPSADHSRPIRPNRLTATIFQTALARRSESPGSSSISPGRPIPSPPVPNAPPFPAPSPLGASAPPRSRPQPSSPPGSVPCLTVSARRRRPPRYRYGDRHRHEYEYRHKYKDRNDTGTVCALALIFLRLLGTFPRLCCLVSAASLRCLCRFSIPTLPPLFIFPTLLPLRPYGRSHCRISPPIAHRDPPRSNSAALLPPSFPADKNKSGTLLQAFPIS